MQKKIWKLKTPLTAFIVPLCRSRLLAVAVDRPPLDNLLIGVDDPGEVIARLQDVTCETKGSKVRDGKMKTARKWLLIR